MATIASRLSRLAAGFDPAWLRDLGRRIPPDVVDEVIRLVAELPPSERNWLTRLAIQRTVTSVSIEALMSIETPVSGEPLASNGPSEIVQDAHAAMAWLEAAGLASRLDGASTTWQVSPLLHRVLVQRQRDHDPNGARRAHGVLVEVFLAAEQPERDGDLLFHARAAGRWDVLAWLWRRRGIGLLQRSPEVAAWAYGAPPPKALERYPSLRLAELLAEGAGTDQRLLRVIATEIETVLAGLPVAGDAAEMLAAGTLAMIALRDTGDITGANRIVDVVEKELSRRGEATHAQAWILFCVESAVARLLAGRLVDVRHYAGIAAAEAAGIEGSDGLRTQALGLLGLVNSILGWTDRAAAAMPDESSTANHSPLDAMVTLPARIARAHIAADELDLTLLSELVESFGDPEDPTPLWPFIMVARTLRGLLLGEALREIPELDRIASFRRGWLAGNASPARLLGRCRTEVLLAGGDVQRAAAILQSVNELPPELRVPMARLHLQTAEFEQAYRFTAEVLADPMLSPRERGTFEIICAAALIGMGRDDEAAVQLSAWSSSVETAPPGWVIQLAMLPFQHRGRLLELMPATCVPEVVRRRLEALRGPLPAMEPRIVSLSGRERIVLQQLNTTLTIAEIARRLSVSPNTVKKQSVAVYRKLGVTGRESAIRRALQLGLLDTR